MATVKPSYPSPKPPAGGRTIPADGGPGRPGGSYTMLVKDLMQKEVFTIGPDDQVDRAFFLIHYEKVRHLPVIERGHLIGIVSDRDLYKSLGPKSQRGAVATGANPSQLRVIPRKVRHIMRRGVITVEPHDHVSKAAALLARKKIGALPVMEKDQLIGIVTATDLLGAFARMTAVEEPSP